MRLIDANALKEEFIKIANVMANNDFLTYAGAMEEAAKMAERQPTIEAEPVRYGHWIKTRRHLWEKDEQGQINLFAAEADFHNGPRCEICHLTVCEHCTPNYNELENCEEHYICSECGRMEMRREPYCHCGAKMNGGAEYGHRKCESKDSEASGARR